MFGFYYGIVLYFNLVLNDYCFINDLFLFKKCFIGKKRRVKVNRVGNRNICVC